MEEPTVESLKARIDELERKLAGRDEPAQDWRSVVGMFDDSELMPQILAEGRAYRQRLRDQADDLGRRGPGDAAVEEPEDEHLAADVRVGVGVPFGIDDRLLGVRERNPKPSHP